MPGLSQRINNISGDYSDTKTGYQNPLVRNESNGFWSKQRNDVSYNQLQKFWCELTPQARQKLLRIDKQTLFEHARKNMYCSRCNGLLLEGYLQIAMYGKSLQQDVASGQYNLTARKTQDDANLRIENGCQDDAQDPSVHPWGGLTAARDGSLTILDCYLCSKSLKGLQNVFDSARARERERELLYPDACGGGGRGWISQGMTGYGRGHGTRETCALHTARLSVETLVDFWSALGEETRHSLLRMKEEDFIERLMYRFDSKRFCRDCRRNVIREFKELKELKRMRKDPRCTSWFCVADTAFQYEVSCDTVQADWHQTFLDAFGTYHHFEWAIGTGEGKSDILEFENVGLSVRVQVNGLDLSGLSDCYITLRAWKMDGRCNELCVKAHAMRGQQCVHGRLVVGDGFVTITRGEGIRRFFEHAEEAEEEEDDDSVDKDGNELDGECSRPQKHAKSPELAREFLLDAATVIFKEQVEKAFREGTARQNAHSIFVCLALKLLEERVHVACKEIITLEKQMKLLEEEEKEKREEEERKERRRTKEREKKLRRKERLKEKENREKQCSELNVDSIAPDASPEEPTTFVDENCDDVSNKSSANEAGDATPASPMYSDIQEDQLLTDYTDSNMGNHSEDIQYGEFDNTRDWNTSFQNDSFKCSRRKLKFHKDPQPDWNFRWSDRRKGAAPLDNGVIFGKYDGRFHADAVETTRTSGGFNKQLRNNAAKSYNRNPGPKSGEKFQCPNNQKGDRYDPRGCSCNHHGDHRSRPESLVTRVVRDPKYVNKLESPSDISKPYYRGNKSNEVEGLREMNGRPKSKIIAGNPPYIKKVWEPLDSQKKYARSSSDSDITLGSTPKLEVSECDEIPKSYGATTYDGTTDDTVSVNHEDNDDLTKSMAENGKNNESEFRASSNSYIYPKESVPVDSKLTHHSSISSSSNSDNCSSCLSEGDSNTSSLNPQNLESTSTSDSEESCQNSEERETSHCLKMGFTECNSVVDVHNSTMGQDTKIQEHGSTKKTSLSSLPTEVAAYSENRLANLSIGAQTQSVVPQVQNQSIHYPVLQGPTMGYYHQSPISWPAGQTNGLMSFPHSNQYLFGNAYGYGLNGNAQVMQYGNLQHLAPPLLNPAQLPVFQPVTQINSVGAREHAKVIEDQGGLKEAQRKLPSVTATGQHIASSVAEAGTIEKPDKVDMRNDGFSLFHFGGPIALSTGFKVNPASSEEVIMGNTSQNNSNNPCDQKDSIEEYNLFASSNGIKFSFL